MTTDFLDADGRRSRVAPEIIEESAKQENMKEILELIKNTSVGLLLLAFLAYLLKILFEKSLEKSIDRVASKMADIGRTSLDIKKSLRNEEREELLALRVAIENRQN